MAPITDGCIATKRLRAQQSRYYCSFCKVFYVGMLVMAKIAFITLGNFIVLKVLYIVCNLLVNRGI